MLQVPYIIAKHQDSPFPWIPPTYRKNSNIIETKIPTKILHNKIKCIQEVCGTFYFYADFIDGTMLTALGTLANQQNKPTNVTMQQLNNCWDYCASHPDTEISYYPSGMKLQIYSNCSYRPLPQANS